MEKPTVLIADDNDNDVVLLRRIIARVGFTESIQVVSDGAEAIDYLSGTGKFADRSVYPFPQLMILDMAMPRKSGEDVMEWMKGKPELQRILVIVMTSVSRHPSSKKMFERHGNIVLFNSDFLKPAREVSVEAIASLYESWAKSLTPSKSGG